MSNQNKDLPQIDLSQSVIGGVYQTFGNDKKKAEDVLMGFRQELQNERVKVEKDCQNTFHDLPIETVLACVKKNNWDSEKCLLELTHIRSILEEEAIHNKKLEEKRLAQEKAAQEVKRLEEAKLEVQVAPKEEEVVIVPKQVSTVIAVPQYVEVSTPISLDITSLTLAEKSWIGMYDVHETRSSCYLTYQYVSSAQNGQLVFTSPSHVCDVDFRVFEPTQDSPFCTTKSVHVGPDVQILAVLKEDKIHGAYTQLFGTPISSGWLGLYPSNETNSKKYLSYQNLADHKDGQFVFDAPLAPKDYNIRLFTTSMFSSYHHIAQSGDVTICGSDSCFITRDGDFIVAKPTCLTYDPAINKVWIGLYGVSENEAKNYLDYAYLKDRFSEVKIPCPKVDGKYQIRVIRKYRVLATSNSIQIKQQE